MSKYDKYVTSGAINKYARYAEDPEKTFNQFESGLLGIRTGASLGTSDEAAGGRAARAQLLPKWANRAFEGASSGLPIVQAVQGAIDLGVGLTVENAPQFRDTQARRSYEAARDSDRLINETSRADNPYSMLAGELIGGIATGPPIATGAKSIKTVSVEAAKRATALTAKAQKVTSATQKAALLKKAADAQAISVRLARPAATMGEAAGRLGSQAVAGATKGGAVGALHGAGYGFGTAEGELEDRAQGAAAGALIGSIGGAILTPAVQGLAKVGGEIAYKIRTPAEMKALDMVIKRAERSGTDLRAVKTQFDEWSKTGEVPETLAELMGPNERSLLSALITVNRETREQATGVFVGRGREEVNRLEDAFSKSFGAGRGDYQKTKVAAQQARAKEAEPFYEGAYVDTATGQRKFLGQPETDALVYEVGGSRVAQSTLSTASDYADALGQRAIRDEIDDFARAIKAGGPVKPLSVQAADYIERGINRRYNAATKGEAQDIPAGLKGLRDRVRTIIDPSGLGDARAVAREAIRRGELLDEGLGIMSPTVDVDDVEAVMRGLPDAGIPAASDAGRTAYGVGASRAVANKLRNVPDMAGFADAARTVARTPALRDKLEAARPKVLTKSGAENKGSKQTKANAALDQAIERASDRAQFGVDMVGNSKTAFRQGDVEDALMDDAMSTQAGELIGDLLISGAGGVTQKLQDKLGRSIGNRLGQPSIYRPRTNREAANILLATGEQIPIQIARIAKRAAERANGRSGPPSGGQPPAGGTPAANALAQKPGKLGTRTADAAAIATLGLQGGTADADTGGLSAELQKANERIALAEKTTADTRSGITKLQSQLEMLQDPAGDIAAKQSILKLRGRKLGTTGPEGDGVDGVDGPNTTLAINDEAAKIEAAIAREQASLEKAQIAEAEEIKAAKQIRMQKIQADAQPSKNTELAREFGPYGGVAAGIAAAYLMRRGAGQKFGKASQKAADSANALLTNAPISLRAGVQHPNSINVRATNLNDFARQGGAPSGTTPFDDKQTGLFRPRAKKNTVDPSDLYPKPGFMAARLRIPDYGWSATGLIEGQVAGGFRAKEEKKIAEYEKDVERFAAKGDEAGLQRASANLQQAKNMYAIALAFERAGYAYAGTRMLAGLKDPYKFVRPDIKGYEAEASSLRTAMNKK
jgi:hypothetical protein